MSVDEPNQGDAPVTSREPSTERTTELVDDDSDTDPVLTVVMPTLNEEAGIEECITRVKNAVVELSVPTEIVVSDSSTDRTPEIAREMGARVVEPDRDGYGYAYQYGFDHARGEYIAMGDADTTYDFEQLPRLYREVADGGADLVLGSRFAGEIRDGAMPPLHQYVGNPALTGFLNLFYDTSVSDAHSGFRVFTAEALEQMSLRSTGMEFASEMMMAAGAEGLEVAEVPITYYKREGEATLDSFQDGWRHVKFMLVNAPGQLFSIPGVTMCVVGTVLMLVATLGIELVGQPLGIHSLIGGSLLTLVGFQVGTFGVLSDIATDPVQRPQDRVTRLIRAEFTLERGIGVGLVLLAFGATVAGQMLLRWVSSGFDVLPLVTGDILAFTTILLGVQTVFNSFFASTVATLRRE
jgi:hypothetical protein